MPIWEFALIIWLEAGIDRPFNIRRHLQNILAQAGPDVSVAFW